jgi:selenocysteine lyase/cysteine desulfurase
MADSSCWASASCLGTSQNLIYAMNDLAARHDAKPAVVSVHGGQLDDSLPDLQAGFVGGNLDKWIGAPLGPGFIYVRKQRPADLVRLVAAIREIAAG